MQLNGSFIIIIFVNLFFFCHGSFHLTMDSKRAGSRNGTLYSTVNDMYMDSIEAPLTSLLGSVF